ncbi:MAG: hypothetical protein ACI81T_003091 [Bacteroidia bacterium]|jgi:hypothetical protein
MRQGFSVGIDIAKKDLIVDNLCDSRCYVRHATRKTIFDWLEIRFFNRVISTSTKFVREPLSKE